MERTTRTVRSRSKYKKGEGTAKRTAVPEKKAGSNFIIQGSILAIAGIIVRLIGMLYRIPLANYIGDEGNGYYSAAYNIYSIMLILSSYSLPVAVSKMVSARLARGQYRNARKILRAALFYATIVGGEDSVLYGLAPAFCGACDQDALQRLCFKGTGADGLDHGLSGGPQRIFPGTFHHGTNGCFSDF